MGDYPTVLDLVGDTPLVRLTRVVPEEAALVLAKLEYLNPGGSVKDRVGLPMIERAEREGKLKPGGTIVEPTSGNTGVGLAIAAALKGYRCIFVMPDKMSREKISLLRAYGAEVVVCPTNVAPDDPQSYYSVSDRLARETPGAYKPDQYSNPANPEAHYRTTGPEIWAQTEGRLDAFVCCVGTGGTISGTARFLKERNPGLLVVGVDAEGSIYTSPDDVRPYLVEGFGEDFYPETFERDVVSSWLTVSDQDCFDFTRRLAREEGILAGGSSGAAAFAASKVAVELGPGKVVVTLFPDGGRGYLSKIFDDEWMQTHGFLSFLSFSRSSKRGRLSVGALLEDKRRAGETPELVVVSAEATVKDAVSLLHRHGISQLPVVKKEPPESLLDVVGSVDEGGLLEHVYADPDVLAKKVGAVMGPPLPLVGARDDVESAFADLTGDSSAVLVADVGDPVGVLSRSDLLEYLAEH